MEKAELLALLRDLEWAGAAFADYPYCPMCLGLRVHVMPCRLADAITELEGSV